MNFREKYTFEERRRVANEILLNHPSCIPVICEYPRNSTFVNIKTRFVVRRDDTIAKFLIELRKTCSLNYDMALFIMVNNHLPPTTSFIGDIYEKYKFDDGLLYFTVMEEAVFG